jgi:hypothetical protein
MRKEPSSPVDGFCGDLPRILPFAMRMSCGQEGKTARSVISCIIKPYYDSADGEAFETRLRARGPGATMRV